MTLRRCELRRRRCCTARWFLISERRSASTNSEEATSEVRCLTLADEDEGRYRSGLAEMSGEPGGMTIESEGDRGPKERKPEDWMQQKQVGG